MACDHCEELKDEIRFLRRELGIQTEADEVNRFIVEWGLSRTQASILSILNSRPGSVISRESIWDTLYRDGRSEPSMKIVDVFVCKLRARLPADFILSVWGSGYLLSAEAVATLAALLKSSPAPPVKIRSRTQRITPARVQTHAFRHSVLRLLTSGPKNYRQIQEVLPPAAKYQAGSMAATFVREGWATKIPAAGPGDLSRWCLTKAGFDRVASFEPVLAVAS